MRSFTTVLAFTFLIAIFSGTTSAFAPVPASAIKSKVATSSLFHTQKVLISSKLTAIRDDEDVNVNLLPDVDAATLTAIGFGLIAFNFFVLANMGDGGIGGIVARIINS